jgi:hypothetical protein
MYDYCLKLTTTMKNEQQILPTPQGVSHKRFANITDFEPLLSEVFL